MRQSIYQSINPPIHRSPANWWHWTAVGIGISTHLPLELGGCARAHEQVLIVAGRKPTCTTVRHTSTMTHGIRYESIKNGVVSNQ